MISTLSTWKPSDGNTPQGTLYTKAEDFGYAESNPARRIELFPEKSRERFLQPKELKRFFDALALEKQIFQDFFISLLLTRARRSNVQAMRWEHLDFDDGVWTIPDDQTKSNETYRIPITAELNKILQRRHGEVNSKWVFPSKGKTGHLIEPKSSWRRILKNAEIENLQIHDLRRSLGSWMTSTGASLPVIGKTLGHKSTAATQVYSRLNLDPVRVAVVVATKEILKAGGALQEPKLIDTEKKNAKKS